MPDAGEARTGKPHMSRKLLILTLALMTVIVVGCSSGKGTSEQVTPPGDSGIPGAPDLANLDHDETEAEIIRLLREGHSLYTRTRIFPGVRHPRLPCLLMVQIMCDTYPETFVDESWVSTDSAGLSEKSYARRSTVDGTVLATAVNGAWTDLASGEQWTSGGTGSDMIEYVRQFFTKIDRELQRSPDGAEVIDGEILGRPSKVFPEGEFEYQVANPLIQRTTRWQDDDNGGREMISEIRTLGFAMVPPELLPDFATAS